MLNFCKTNIKKIKKSKKNQQQKIIYVKKYYFAFLKLMKKKLRYHGIFDLGFNFKISNNFITNSSYSMKDFNPNFKRNLIS